MDIKIYNNETKIKEIKEKLNIPVKENESEIDLNKVNDINTTNEDDSIYTTDEIISYCSSPTSGLVSIQKTKNNDNSFINIPAEISNITNTITFTIAMIKKEIDETEFSTEIGRSNTDKKKHTKEQKDNENNNNGNCKTIGNNENNHNDKDKKDKMQSNFKKKTKKIKDTKVMTKPIIADLNRTANIKKKSSKVKKKKTKKSQEKHETTKNLEHSRSSTNIDKDKIIKKARKKTQKLKEQKDFQKLIKKKYENDEADMGKSPKIIILDFSTSINNEDLEDGSERIHKKDEEEISDIHKTLNLSMNKLGESDFFTKKNKTKNDDEDIIHNKQFNNEFNTDKKYITPKSKNSCFLVNSYKTSHSRLENNLNNRKFSFNYGNSSILKKTSTIKREDFFKVNSKKDKKRKQTEEDFFNLCASKNFNHNDEQYQNKILNTTAIKENIKKSNKNKKIKKMILNPRKDSNKSCHNTPNKKFRHIISHNYEKKVNNFEKRMNINMTINPKASESSSLTNTPKNYRPKKSIYNSNRNLTKIKISSQAVENKDIHLEMNGKQETIINYTNQEMVDDENEYMVECFKVLLKLDLSKQPRCKSKVNFNFENSPSEKNKKKIALFDLDETLVHCTKDQKGLNGDSVNIKLPTNKVVNVGLNIRPHWKEALDLIKKHYHIVVYTASHQSYADAVLDYLDKENKYFQYRLYRNHCVQCDVDGIKFYVKDLDTLNEKYNLKDVVLIDNSVLSFAYHLNNGIPIVPYIEQKEDSQLLMLAYYLVSIANFDDLTEENKKHINIEHFILQVKNLENEEEEENDDENEGDGNNEDNNNNNKEEVKDNSKDNSAINENNNEVGNDNNENKENSIKKDMSKQSSVDSQKKRKKLSIRKSEKALRIAKDMQLNMVDIYNKNYN